MFGSITTTARDIARQVGLAQGTVQGRLLVCTVTMNQLYRPRDLYREDDLSTWEGSNTAMWNCA
jgi:hypothetical protein